MDPAMLKVPSWDDILGLMHSEKRRQFKIDVETDSTIAGTLSSDMAGLSQVLTAISQAMTELAPMVQQGVLPVDAAKEIIMTVIRRARMGMAVEDAFDKLQAPKQQTDPEAAKAQASMQEVQVKAQADMQVAKMKADLDAHLAQVQQQAQEQQNAREQAMEAQRDQQKAASEAAEAHQKMQAEAADRAHKEAIEMMRVQSETERAASALETQRMIADANNETKVIIAHITAGNAAAMQAQQQAHEQQMAAMQPKETEDEAPTAAEYKAPEQDMGQLIEKMTTIMSRPRKVIRDDQGRIAGVE